VTSFYLNCGGLGDISLDVGQLVVSTMVSIDEARAAALPRAGRSFCGHWSVHIITRTAHCAGLTMDGAGYDVDGLFRR
jgi:hypothetical protein